MSRPRRIECSCAIYHATFRGDRRELTFVDDGDRHALLTLVAQAMGRFNAAVLAYCLMGKHCHFVLHTHRAKLSRLLHHLLEWRVRAVICTALRASRSGSLCSANRFWPLRRAGP